MTIAAVAARVANGETATFRPRASKRRKLASLLGEGWRARAVITASARDASGNATQQQLAVRVRR